MFLHVLILVLCTGMAGVTYVYARKGPWRTVGIHDLPFELLSEIASHLDFVDVISLRQSTKKLRRATEARVVWFSLAKKYITRHLNIPRPENGTIDTLRTDSLRQWIWPRLVIDQVWRSKSAASTTRTFDVDKRTECVSLIPGGRWFLAVRNTGQVDFYDLDSKEPVPRLLLEPLGPHEEVSLTPLVIDVSSEAPLLDFTFAFSSTESTWQQDASFGGLHVRRAKLTQTELSATLVAQKLVSIPHIRKGATLYTTGLGGNLVARNVIYQSTSWIEVFKWKECTPTELMLACLRAEWGFLCNMIYFIGENRILCVARSRIFIYQIPAFSRLLVDWDPAIGYQSDEDVTQPIWSYTDKPFTLRGVPSFYLDGLTNCRLVVQDKGDLLGICIPLSPDHQPYVCFRVEPPFLLHIGTGLYKACAIHEDAPVIRLGYSWDADAESNFIHIQGKKSARTSQVLLDEETGRCLYRKRSTFRIIDFDSNSYQNI